MNGETIHSLKIELDESQLPPITSALKKPGSVDLVRQETTKPAYAGFFVPEG